MTTVPQVQITARDYYVVTKGIPLGAAIALVSVLYYESNLNPGSQGYQSTETPGVLNPHGAYGIASWNGPRQNTLLQFATTHNLTVSSLDTQLAFVLTEIANGYPNCWAAIRSTASYQAIISILVDEYENPKNKPAEINGALAIAGPLAALPPPQPAPPVAVPAAPAPKVPVPVTPPSAASVGLPPISATSAGRRAAEQAYIAAMITQLEAEVAALNEEISDFQGMAATLAKRNPAPAPTTQLSLSPVLPAPAAAPAASTTITIQGNQPMAVINWKTTVSGLIAAAGGIATQFPQFAPYAHLISSLGSAALGFFAADATTTKPVA